MVSSAYWKIVDSYVPVFIPVIFLLDFELIQRISVAIIKSNVNKEHPCLMPLFTVNVLDSQPLFFIVIVCSLYKVLTQDSIFSLKPNLFSGFDIKFQSKESKAFLKSNVNKIPETLFQSNQ